MTTNKILHSPAIRSTASFSDAACKSTKIFDAFTNSFTNASGISSLGTRALVLFWKGSAPQWERRASRRGGGMPRKPFPTR